MFGKLGDMMSRLQEMKQKAEEVKAILADTVLSVEGAGGDIKIAITGDRKIKDLHIAPALQHGDIGELQEQLLVTLNRAIAQADKVNEEEMKKAAGGIMPGL
jgi:hypothetical protein